MSRSETQHVVGQPSMVGSFRVTRLFPSETAEAIDPFLFLDFFDAEVPPNKAMPSNAHPHRGFETVSVILEGEAGYRDSLGNKGVLQRGSVEWMTAGSGIVHDGHSDHEFAKRGGRMMGIQLWVNLPARLKMMDPAARYLPPSTFPTAQLAGATARVLAGKAHGVDPGVETKVPMLLIEYNLQAAATVELGVPAEWNAFAHVCEGALVVQSGNVAAGELLRFGVDGEDIRLQAGADGARVIVGAGAPLGEPIAAGGPFVMNTQAELRQAFFDYQSGRMGRLD